MEVRAWRLWFMGTRVETNQVGHEAVPGRKPPRPISWPQWEAVVRAAVKATPMLAEAIKQFWGLPVKLVFFSATHKSHYYWQVDDFHVSQLVLPGVNVPNEDGSEDQAMALLRISDSACSSLLTQVLGPRPAKPFSFKQLSPLETTILNEFSRDILTVLMKSLIRKPKGGGKKVRMDRIHLIWAVQIEEPEDPLPHRRPLKFREPLEIGKILVTLPIGAVKIETPPPDAPPPAEVPDPFFYHVENAARLYVGRTRVPLSDLDNLEAGDLVVFENSNAGQLHLIEPDTETHLPFTVEIPQKQHLLVPLTQDIAMDTQQQLTAARQKLWDNLMIEVDAEFLPIKLPLKQLKQMSEGLVVEMGDLVNNEICLKVEGKPLAYGELVIVGDKFGVRIKEVKGDEGALEEAAPPVPAAAKAAAPKAAKPAAKAAPASPAEGISPATPPPPPLPAGEALPAPPPAEGEEAEVEQFLNDDFDDTFDDEEDW